MRLIVFIALLVACLSAEILDRTVAIVGSSSILSSEVEAQSRLEAMFNSEPLDTSEAALEMALERLIEQRLLQEQMRLSGFQAMSDSEVEARSRELAAQGFGELSFPAALQRYGVSEQQAFGFVGRQLRFADYVRFRFRSGLEASPEAIRAEYRRRFAGREDAPAIEDVEDELAEAVRLKAAEDNLDDLIRRLRASTRIVRLPLLNVVPAEQTP